ncbi:MAG TPA: hypothetical protein VKE88_03885 [Candidatus Nanoarchaeia archaeon]|nr:hypothetical protein [Candidatus Nanoarchaeia archaeon]
MQNGRKLAGKVWNFIWHDESIWSLLANIVLSIILIKFIIFPVLGLILGTSHPVVAVVSSSMEHDGSFTTWWTSAALCGTEVCTQEKWYADHNITQEQFKTFDYKNGFNKGDIMILSSPKNAEVGDIIIFISNDGRPIIHRLVSTNPLQTKGDHNQAQIVNEVINEKNIQSERIIGKASLRIPFLGYIKILFVNLLSLFGIQVS